MEFGRVAIRQWLLKRNNTRSSSSDEDLDRDRIRIAQKQQLSPQRIYFQEMQKRKMEWERRRESDGDNRLNNKYYETIRNSEIVDGEQIGENVFSMTVESLSGVDPTFSC